MTKTESILIVVDPTADTHPAVERGMLLAASCGYRAELFICAYSSQIVGSQFLDPKKLDHAKRGHLDDHRKFLTQLAEPYADQRIEISIKVSWDRPRYEGIIRQALHSDSRMVIKDTHYHSRLRRTFFTNTDWHLVRSCPAPLWLVKPGRAFEAPVILAAVDPLHDRDKPAALDARLLSESFELADELGGVVHVFHAFNPFVEPDDPHQAEAEHEQALLKLADTAQIPRDRVHLHAGNAADLLSPLATELDVDLVVMGAVSRSRLEHAIIGSTAEEVVDMLPCDVLVVKPKGFISPVTFKSAPSGVIYAD